VKAALGATALAMLLGTLAAMAVARYRFFGRETISFLVILPLALPGVVAGSIFTFSLTLGDYITPQLVASTQFIGNVVYINVGVATILPLAAACATRSRPASSAGCWPPRWPWCSGRWRRSRWRATASSAATRSRSS
jgi:ABC-type spermidine/putrescine transport system permease subunit I